MPDHCDTPPRRDAQEEEAGIMHDETLDLTILQETFGDDHTKIGQILKRFLVIASGVIDEIERHIEEADANAIGDLSHKLKSSALTTGAFALAEVCGTLEDAGRLSDWRAIAQAKDMLRPALNDVTRAIEKRARQSPPQRTIPC